MYGIITFISCRTYFRGHVERNLPNASVSVERQTTRQSPAVPYDGEEYISSFIASENARFGNIRYAEDASWCGLCSVPLKKK